MSYRDPHAMLECLFYVNELPGGEAHHDGGMKGRDHAAVLANPMLQLSADEQAALDRLQQQPKRIVVSDGAAEAGIAEPGAVAGRCRRRSQLPGTDKPVTRACRIRSGLCRGREEISRRSVSSCRAI